MYPFSEVRTETPGIKYLQYFCPRVERGRSPKIELHTHPIRATRFEIHFDFWCYQHTRSLASMSPDWTSQDYPDRSDRSDRSCSASRGPRSHRRSLLRGTANGGAGDHPRAGQRVCWKTWKTWTSHEVCDSLGRGGHFGVSTVCLDLPLEPQCRLAALNHREKGVSFGVCHPQILH